MLLDAIIAALKISIGIGALLIVVVEAFERPANERDDISEN